jgi:hypothetical protein
MTSIFVPLSPLGGERVGVRGVELKKCLLTPALSSFGEEREKTGRVANRLRKISGNTDLKNLCHCKI